jgi:hypothetical protein
VPSAGLVSKVETRFKQFLNINLYGHKCVLLLSSPSALKKSGVMQKVVSFNVLPMYYNRDETVRPDVLGA